MAGNKPELSRATRERHSRTGAIVASIEHTDASSSVRQLQDAGKAVVGAAGSVAVDRVRAEVDARSSRAAVELKAFAVAIRASASSLREQGHSSDADMIDQLARRADRLAAHLSTASTDQLVEDARRLSQEAVAFARREPALAVAGAFVVGLLIPKMLDLIAARRAMHGSSSEPKPNDLQVATRPEMSELEVTNLEPTPDAEEET